MSGSIIYDDDEIRVIWTPGQGQAAMITFGDAISFADGVKFFAEKPLKKLDMPAIGVMPKRANWFPAAAMLKAVEQIAPRLEGFATRLIYGGSMGGYAAIKFSRLLSATHVLALCPQWSIDKAEWTNFNPGWQEHFRSALTGMGIRADDVAGAIFIFSDPYDRHDRAHVAKILEQAPQARLIPVPFVRHDVTTAFAGSQNLDRLIAACRAQDVTALFRLSRAIRRQSAPYLTRLEHFATARLPRLALRIALHHRDSRVIRAASLPAVLTNLKRAGELARARDYVHQFIRDHAVTDANHFMILLWAAEFLGQRLTLASHHGATLAYDLATGQVAAARLAAEPWRIPLGLKLNGRCCRLFLRLGDRKFYIDDGMRLRPEAEANAATRFDLELDASHRLSIRSPKGYLTADPSGRMAFNRPQAHDWEKFQLVLS